MNRRASLLRSLRIATVIVGAALASLTLKDAHAGWPPAPGADMADPSNWPNDPGYHSPPDQPLSGQWNLWSYLPKQLPGTPAYTPADVKLGASGMRIDQGWTYTIGSFVRGGVVQETKIAVIDCGIEWDNTDLINKAYLNAGELTGVAKPETSAGAACGGTGALAGYDCDGDGVFSVSDYLNDPRIAPVVTGGVCYVPGSSTVAQCANPSMPTQMINCPRLLGDVNANCVIDPGDIIQLFSDGIDQDKNGYTDDISGWDFFKNDNNPYDDTRYGHGTGEARDSSAQANNDNGDAGVCPQCRFMMMRAGNSFIADATDFAKGVVYATDNGAKVIQEALGTIDQTAFSRAAIDYAYSKNVTVVASMADENSRHHNLPGVWNHTLPVHAITYQGESIDTAWSFLAFNTCSNFGGQMALSTSGESCSSEATGKTSGITGLIYSYSDQLGLNLTAEEVMQLLKQTADNIDVPESHSSNPGIADQYYESLPYCSQRFGYGRPNVPKAFEAMKQGLIPPEVDITSPMWFQTLYSDRVSGPVPIFGRVVAARAMSYDYIVEWAPGVEPSDAEFKPLLMTVSNVPGGTVTGGGDTPLAMIDPRNIDTAHTPDPDSPHGENKRTVTLRVGVTAHYSKGEVHGEARRTLAIVNKMNGLDEDLLPGFPITLPASAEGGAKLADIDGDGVRDIVLGTTDGSLNVFTVASGVPVQAKGFPYTTKLIDGLDPKPAEATLPSYLSAPAYKAGASGGISPAVTHEAISGSPAIADVNGDGKMEIAFVTWPGTIYLIDSVGHDLPGWPKRLGLVPSCPMDPSASKPPGPCMDATHNWARGAYGSPVLYDMDGDGRLEVIVAAFDGNIYIYHDDGSALAGWPVAIHHPQATIMNRIMTTPTIADFNKDGIPDVATGSNEELGGGGAGPVFVVDGRGTKAPGGPYLKDWPIAIVSLHLFPVVAEGIDSSQAVLDMTGDGSSDLFIMGNGNPPTVVPADPGVQQGLNTPPNILPIRGSGAPVTRGFDPTSLFGDLSNAKRPDTMFPLFSQPSIGDLDEDGTPDVILSGGSLSLAGNLAGGSSANPFQHLLGFWSGKTGSMFRGSPFVIEDYTFLTSEAIADITGDGYPEIIEGNGAYFVHAVDACGREAEGWPKFTDGWVTATPAVGDITGSHTLDVVDSTRDGYLYAWKTKGTDTGVVQWESFHHDNANTGNYSIKLDQGVTMVGGTKPIDCDAPPPPPKKTPPPLTPTSAAGCSCELAGGSSFGSAPGAWALVMGVGLLFARRRKTLSKSLSS
jgi:MYXO-CTERM domain-containing protein